VGVVRELMPDGLARVEVRNRFEKDEELEIFFPDFKMDFIQTVGLLKNPLGETVEVAHGGAGDIFIKLDKDVFPGVLLRKKR